MSDPALDLAVVMAVLSSNIDTALPGDTVFAGEVGLSGEIRAVSRIEQRISEAGKLGFRQIFVPLGNKKGITHRHRGSLRLQNRRCLPATIRIKSMFTDYSKRITCAVALSISVMVLPTLALMKVGSQTT